MSEKSGQYQKNISIGSSVGITTREERNKIQKGKVVKHLTRSDFHTHGIMVELDNGLVGRVKEIYGSISIDNTPNGSESIPVDPNGENREPTITSISIEEDSTGHSYKKLFYPYIKDAQEIIIEDAYIRIDYQIKNLVFFCSMIEGSKEAVNVKLITSFDSEYKKHDQEKKLNELKETLVDMDVKFSYCFDDTLHDRIIRTDSGWRIILGRGLDIFKDTGSYYSPANFDQTKRKCKKTEIVYMRDQNE